jgi:hypothetical protein
MGGAGVAQLGDWATGWMNLDSNPGGAWDSSLLKVQTGSGNSILGVKRPGRDINHSHLSYDEVENEWSYTSPSPICLRDLNRYSFTFTVCR